MIFLRSKKYRIMVNKVNPGKSIHEKENLRSTRLSWHRAAQDCIATNGADFSGLSRHILIE